MQDREKITSEGVKHERKSNNGPRPANTYHIFPIPDTWHGWIGRKSSSTKADVDKEAT